MSKATSQRAKHEAGRSFGPSWLLVALVVAAAAAVRIRLLGIPLERDEGEYAYAGQLLLQGIPPYQLAFNMKFPGTYAAYAAIMALFGQTIAGIHLGFLLVNATTIVLVYLLDKRLLSPRAGVASCAAYALLSLGQGILGAQAHATHFVVLAAVGGTLQLVRALDSRRWTALAWSGALYGAGILMKQPGALFALFGGLYLAWDHFTQWENPWHSAPKKLALFFGGVSVPLALTGLSLWWAGVFGKFWFWTFAYGREYALRVSFAAGMDSFIATFPRVVGPTFALWIFATLGLLLTWWRNGDRRAAVFTTGFLVFSFLAVCPGLYFREHYFVLLLPAIALLAGAAVEVLGRHWPRAAWPACVAYVVALLLPVIQQREFLFQMSPLEISRALYGQNPFPEAIQIGDYIRTHSATDARIAVLGSEPKILFYANRRSASGHIYMYGLMENQPYALAMQKEFTRDMEATQPDYVIFVTSPTSWLRQPESPVELFNWWNAYRPRHYTVAGVADIGTDHTEYRWEDVATYKARSSSLVVVYKRNN